MRTDRERLDGLNRLPKKFTGLVSLSWSQNGTGWVMKEDKSVDGGKTSVREAIDSFLEREEFRRW